MIAESEAKFGRIDNLINNAWVADFGPIAETTFERWRTVMATNLDGVFLCSQAAIPALKKTKGCIVNVAASRDCAHPHFALRTARLKRLSCN